MNERNSEIRHDKDTVNEGERYDQVEEDRKKREVWKV